MQRAEAWVLAHGYTEASGTIDPSQLQYEMTDRSEFEDVMAARRGQLKAEAVCANGAGETWSVVFAYLDPSNASVARVVQLGPGDAVKLVHQDAILEMFCPSHQDRALR